MTAPFDPEETHGNEHGDEPREELLDANSMTWGTADPDFDEMFRERLGPLPIMPTPPYAFERVLVTGRRRRARKVWAGTAAAALVVLAGTAGTTVALHGGSPNGPTIGAANGSSNAGPASTKASSSPSATSPAVVASPSKAATSPAAPTSAATTGQASPSTTPSTPACLTADFTLSVSTQIAADGSDQLHVVLTNTSGHSCTTKGYPGLELETQGQQDQSTTVTRVDKSTVQQLTVAANQPISTTATYSALASGASPGPDCGAPSYYLAIIPPNQQTQIVQPITGGPITVCGSGNLDTTPLVTGSGG
jgi:hypothetical protein